MRILNCLEKWKEWFILLIIFIPTVFLRFYNLGYSDYIGDEHKALIILNEGQSLTNFLLNQRKGPLQFIISYIPYLFTHDFKNELAERMPFAIINVLAILVFYKFVQRITKSSLTGLLAALLLSFCGFIVGFGRIAQYQSLNLLFSFLALWFYSIGLFGSGACGTVLLGRTALRRSLLGTLFLSLSLLSHWDAVFILPMVIYIFIRFLLAKDVPIKRKLVLIGANFILGCVLLLPFLIPYVGHQLNSDENMAYFSRRVSMGYSNTNRYKQLVDLYNPFVTFWFYVIAGVLGMLCVKKSYIFTIWFLIAFSIFEIFVRKPGTHIYNFIVPLTILCAIGIVELLKFLPKFARILPVVILIGLYSFFLYQAFVVFVDHRVEYPWQQETFFGYKTPNYHIEDKLPLFGFPLNRYWKEINVYVNEMKAKNNERFGYISNEVKTISEFYMDVKYAAPPKIYAVGIKRPLSFVEDWRFPNMGNKKEVYGFDNEFDERVVRIYRIE